VKHSFACQQSDAEQLPIGKSVSSCTFNITYWSPKVISQYSIFEQQALSPG
jgi:hypothetical protein